MKIVLTGYRCVGKSSAGKLIAERLHVPFYDTDELVEKRTGKKIREIVKAGGWDAFRREERDAVSSLKDINECVIALGGGAILDRSNVECLGSDGIFIWLRAEPETVIQRLKADDRSRETRPSLSGRDLCEETVEIIAAREPVYRSIAGIVIKTDRQTIAEITDRICRRLSTIMK
jgi:shikimate kinase